MSGLFFRGEVQVPVNPASVYCSGADCNGLVQPLIKTALTESAGLPVEQDYNTGRNSEDRHYQVQPLKVEMEQWDQAVHDEPDAQQDHPQVLW
jgi:hypothetical protein